MVADPSSEEEEEEEEARSHVLVLGARGGEGCPERFVRRLLDLAALSEDGGPADAPFHWTLTTKYYRAQLALHVRHAEPGATATPEALDVGEEPHGVILVMDGLAAEGERGLEPWRPWLEAVAERGPELCLCVAVVPGDGDDATDSDDAVREELVRERTLWCLESGFEYVEVDSCSLRGSEQEEQEQAPRRRLPSELREKEGMERVRESIEATPWPTLVRLPRGSGDRAAAAVSGAPGELQGGGLEEEEGQNTAASMGKSVEATTKAEEEGGGGGCAGEMEKRAAAEAATAEWEGLGAGCDDDLEALFDRIRAIRESAPQGSGDGAGAAGGLGDEERRARAAEAALKLAELLGLGEDEDEEQGEHV